MNFNIAHIKLKAASEVATTSDKYLSLKPDASSIALDQKKYQSLLEKAQKQSEKHDDPKPTGLCIFFKGRSIPFRAVAV